MIKQLAFLGAVALVSGCAHSTNENRVVVSESSSPYVTGTSYTYGYGMYTSSEYDNTSKGAGARVMMQNPYAENTYGGYYTAPAAAAGAAGESQMGATSKGAGARSLTGENLQPPPVADKPLVTTTTPTTWSGMDNTSKGQGARTMTSGEQE